MINRLSLLLVKHYVAFGLGMLLVCLVIAFSFACLRSEPTPYVWHLPPGFPEPPVPPDNPMTVEKVELGRHLFYEKQLSGNGLQSCASCHQQELAFTDGVAMPVGSTGQVVNRNSMSLVNIAYNSHFTWAHNGLANLEQQILIPLFNEQPVEMGLTGAQQRVLGALASDKQYQALFAKAFPEAKSITMDNVVKALASFVRSIVSFRSAFDRYAYYGDDSAISEQALEGLALFMSERLECRHCHSGFNFADTSQHASEKGEPDAFHVTGLYYPLNSSLRSPLQPSSQSPLQSVLAGGKVDRGLYHVSGVETDKDRFRAPSLRNIAVTAPYMHDGSIQSLEEVLDFYSSAGRPAIYEGFGDGRQHPHKSLFIKGFSLTEAEKAALMAFFLSLTDNDVLSEARWSQPRND